MEDAVDGAPPTLAGGRTSGCKPFPRIADLQGLPGKVIAMLPFSRHEFFGVFADYNTSVWPAHVLLYALAVALLAMVLYGKSRGTSRIAVGLALLWIWTGIAYHWWRFATINGAAWMFGALFVIEGILLAVAGTVNGSLEIARPKGWKGWTGGMLVAYALVVYPILGLARHPPEEVPVLGVPCPTTIFTFGLLFWAVRPIPRHVVVIPLLWAIIGSSAVFLFGVVQDLGLLVAGLLGLLLLGDGPVNTRKTLAARGRETTSESAAARGSRPARISAARAASGQSP